MVVFTCDMCNEALKKKQVATHRRCRNATFSCMWVFCAHVCFHSHNHLQRLQCHVHTRDLQHAQQMRDWKRAIRWRQLCTKGAKGELPHLNTQTQALMLLGRSETAIMGRAGARHIRKDAKRPRKANTSLSRPPRQHSTQTEAVYQLPQECMQS